MHGPQSLESVLLYTLAMASHNLLQHTLIKQGKTGIKEASEIVPSRMVPSRMVQSRMVPSKMIPSGKMLSKEMVTELLAQNRMSKVMLFVLMKMERRSVKIIMTLYMTDHNIYFR